ncbi:MAG: ATP-binding protein [Tannerella sp.]|nr:ATP-binding protein [Tannerella sp.]
MSPKTDRLAQHLCAFSNQEGGGFLVYGVNDDASMFSVTFRPDRDDQSGYAVG